MTSHRTNEQLPLFMNGQDEKNQVNTKITQNCAHRSNCLHNLFLEKGLYSYVGYR